MRELFKGEKTFFSIDLFFARISRFLLSPIDSARSNRGQAHAVADEDDDVLGDVRVQLLHGLQRIRNFVFADFSPVGCI